MKHILIVEDEHKIAAVLREYFERDGFKVTHLDAGTDAETCIRNTPFSCVVLDLMLPGRDGLEICKAVRQFSDVPIIMLTARVDEIDRLLGLELGADDYVCKPFSPREVVARVRTILRRVERGIQVDTLSYANVLLVPERFQCRVGQTDVELTPVEYRLLARLISQPGRVYSRSELMDGAYEDHRVVSDRTIDSHIKNVRRKLTDAGCDEELIRSIYGVGYKIE